MHCGHGALAITTVLHNLYGTMYSEFPTQCSIFARSMNHPNVPQRNCNTLLQTLHTPTSRRPGRCTEVAVASHITSNTTIS